MRLRRPLVALSAAALIGVGGAVTYASADSPEADGLYACGFNAGAFDCHPTAVVTPTVTVTETATATVTATPTPTPSTTPSASPSPTPPPAPRLLGESYGGDVAGSTAEFPEQTLGRYFFGGAPGTYGSTGGLQATKAGEPLLISFKIAPASVTAGTYDATVKAAFGSWVASGHPVIWAYEHEPENNGFTPAAFQAAYAHLLTLAKAYPTLRSTYIIMGDDFRTNTAERWYVPGVDYIGVDVYNLPREADALAYGHAKGKSVIFPEFGDGPNGSVTTDDGALAYAKAFVGAWDDSVIGGAWFNANNNDLSKLPRTLAYLRTLP